MLALGRRYIIFCRLNVHDFMENKLLIGGSVHALLVGGAGDAGWSLVAWLCCV